MEGIARLIWLCTEAMPACPRGYSHMANPILQQIVAEVELGVEQGIAISKSTYPFRLRQARPWNYCLPCLFLRCVSTSRDHRLRLPAKQANPDCHFFAPGKVLVYPGQQRCDPRGPACEMPDGRCPSSPSACSLDAEHCHPTPHSPCRAQGYPGDNVGTARTRAQWAA